MSNRHERGAARARRIGDVIAGVCIAFVLLLGGLSLVVHAQTKPTTISNTWQIKPTIIATTSAVDISTLPGGPPPGKDVYACWIDAGTAGTATTLTIADKQGTPVNFATAVPIAANSVYSPVLQGPSDQACRWFPGGMVITVANANTLSIYASGKWWNGPAPF